MNNHFKLKHAQIQESISFGYTLLLFSQLRFYLMKG
jgi:hypothetical protein